METKWCWAAEVKKKGDEGFNNAGILTFNSHAVNSLIRELFQNSNDARAENESKISIDIEYSHILKNDVPNINAYEEIIGLIKQAHPDRSRFFQKAKEILGKDKIPFLVYSDSKTKGLSGAENEINSSFVACVLSEGKSVKGSKTAGGSYGIGKNAIYGVSALRTVFYSSMDLRGKTIFQGVAKIASYLKDGINHEGRIYLGEGPDRLSVRNANQIPACFRRDIPGLSQFVMGAELDPSWNIEFTKAILRNYWMLLIEDGLEVRLLKDGNVVTRINKQNTPTLLSEMFAQEEDESSLTPYGNPLLFYDAYVSGERKDFQIPHLGQCHFYYKESEHGENNIAYMRNSMVITSKVEKRLVGAKVTGVFKCANEVGNEVLRKMEPPKHDEFEPQMLEDNHDKLTKPDGERIMRDMKGNVRALIKSLIDKYKQETETPEFLAELFEELQNGIIGGHKGERKNQPSDNETLYKMAAEDEIEISLLSEAENIYTSTPIGAAEQQALGKGDDLGSEPGRNKSKIKGGKGRKGGASKRTPTHTLPISSRIFHFRQTNNYNIYKAIISSQETLGDVEVSLAQRGDAGKDIAFELHKVTDVNGGQISFRELKDADGFVSEYRISFEVNEGKNYFFLVVLDNQKSAFVING